VALAQRNFALELFDSGLELANRGVLKLSLQRDRLQARRWREGIVIDHG
jgi:hypothetical protein